MGLKAAIQALKKAEKLKEKVQNSKDLLNDNDAWLCQQQLQRIYQQVLILDLEYALDRKVEQELWNHGFKNYIGTLQNLAKDKKNPKRPESQAMLSWCLEAASGFYLTLLQEICTAFDLDLPFRRKGSVFGSGKILRAVEHLSQPHKSSCYYICQHCLVHLGDIARYRNQSRQAEAFYRHAVQLAPHSGQPYNQLALLEASRGDRLSTVFHYVRSVEVRHPFPAAATNLARTLTKSAEEQLNVEGRNKLSTSEYISVFLKLHGLLYTGTDFSLSEKYVKILTTTLTAHVATESLTSWKFVQMLAVNLFALHHAGGAMQNEKPLLTVPDDQLTKEESQSRHLILDVMAGSLSALLLPVYTLKDGDALLEYFALPAIKLTLDWIRLEPKVLLDSAFTTRLQIWPSLCKLLNGLQSSVVDLPEKYNSVPLPEDRDLQGFIPLEKVFSDVRFNNQDWNLDAPFMNKLRASRLLEFGNWLTKQEDYHLIVSRLNDNSSVSFEAVGGLQVPPSDLIRELEELSLTKLPSPAPSEASSWGSSITGTSTPDNGLALMPTLAGAHSPPLHLGSDLTQERRSGILKPQGSLEKSREKENVSDISSWNVVGNAAPKRGRQNVALQAIMRKSVMSGENTDTSRNLESKQVTFKTPSPSNSPSSSQGTDEIAVRKAGSKQNAWQHQQQAPQQPVAVAPVIVAAVAAVQTTTGSLKQQQPQLQPLLKQSMQQGSTQPGQPSSQIPQQPIQQQLQSHQQTLMPATTLPQCPQPPMQQTHIQIPQQPPLPYKTGPITTPAQPQTRPVISYVSKEQPSQLTTGIFSGYSGSNQLPLFPSQPLPGVQSATFPAQQQQPQQQPHVYGIKMHQPSYSNWQEEAPSVPPPSAWWGTDQQPVSGNREDTNQQQQLTPSALNLGFYNSLLQQQQQQQQQSVRSLNHLKSEVSGSEVFPNSAWSGHQITTPSSVNLNLHHQLIGGLSAHHHNQFTSPAVSQNHSHLTTSTGFQASQLPRHEIPNHLSVFTTNGNVEADLPKRNVPESTQADVGSVRTCENSTIFSSTPVTGSFSPLAALSANTYSLFSTPNWTGNNVPRTMDMENGSRNGLNSVLGVTSGSSLGLGQQSLWSGPGPSPLERLLEQQKQLREGPAPKGGT